MAKYRITAPDGGTYEVTAPDSASEAEVLAYAQKNHQGAAKPKQPTDFSNVRGRVDTAPEPTIGGRRAGDLPAWKQAAYGLGSSVAGPIVGIGQATGLMGDRQVAESTARIDAVRGTTPGFVGGLAGDVGMLAAPLTKIGQLPRAAQYAASAVAGGAFGGVQPVRDGEDRGRNIMLGGALGAAGQGAGHAVSAVGRRAATTITDLTKELAKVAQKYNIPLHASQVSSSRLAKLIASAGKHLPFSGAGAAAAKQQAAFNAALGETMGVKGATRLSDDVVRGGRAEIGKVYDDVWSRNDVALDKAVIDDLAAIRQRVARSLDKDNAAVVLKNLDYVVENSVGGKIPGKVYQSLRGELTGSGDKVGIFLKEIRGALDKAAARSVGPTDAAALRAANSQWANSSTILDALKQAGGAAENVNPANLWNLVKRGSTKDMRELARLGQVLLKDPIPDSGTAQRGLLYAMMGGGAMNPAAIPLLVKAGLAGATVGRAANSSALTRLMLREGRGQGAQRLAPYVRGGAVAAVPSAPKPKRKDARDRP